MNRYLVTRKGEAKPLPEPELRRRKVRDGRRVGSHLPTELYVAFKAYVAGTGLTGEQVIERAIEQLVGRSPERSDDLR